MLTNQNAEYLGGVSASQSEIFLKGGVSLKNVGVVDYYYENCLMSNWNAVIEF